MRSDEARMLRWSQVNFVEQQITVGKTKSEGGNWAANSDVPNSPPSAETPRSFVRAEVGPSPTGFGTCIRFLTAPGRWTVQVP
jgi:hypothetical protein